MKQSLMKMSVLAVALGLGGSALAADDTTKCGTKQLKAVGALVSTAGKEGARACAQADSDAEADVLAEINDDKLIAATERFNKAITKTEETFGDANCFIDDSNGQTQDAADTISLAEVLGTNACTASP